MKRKYANIEARLQARAADARARRALAAERRAATLVTSHVADVADAGDPNPFNLPPGEAARLAALEQDKASLLGSILRNIPTVAPAVAPAMPDPPALVPAVEAADALARARQLTPDEIATTAAVAAIDEQVAALDADQRAADEEYAMQYPALVTTTPGGSGSLAVARLDEARRMATGSRNFARFKLLEDRGAAESAVRVAADAAAPARIRATLEAFAVGRQVVEAIDAKHEQDTVDAKLAWLDQRTAGVLAQAATARAGIEQWAKEHLASLRGYLAAEPADTDPADSVWYGGLPQSDNAGHGADVWLGDTRRTRSLALVGKFKQQLSLTKQVYDSAVTTLDRYAGDRVGSDGMDDMWQGLEAIRNRVRSSGGVWSQELENSLVTATRRLRTVNQDTVDNLYQLMRGIASLMLDMTTRLDFDTYVTDTAEHSIPKLGRAHFDVEARDNREAREAESLRAEAQMASLRAEAARVREGIKTAAWNASPMNAESEAATAARTAEVRALRGGA